MGEIVGAEVQAQSRGNEVKVQGSATQFLEALIEFAQGSGINPQRNRHLDRLAERKSFKSLLGGKLRVAMAVPHAAGGTQKL
jgi:hypothetical protein